MHLSQRLAPVLLLLTAFEPVQAVGSPSTAPIIAEILQPREATDFASAKLAFDKLIDPTVDTKATMREIDALVFEARKLAGPRASDGAKIDAIRKVIYESGPWNGNRPFAYDHADPLGKNIQNKLLSTYLRTRRGNCVSMPVLFLIIGKRLGLNLSLSTVPHHIFVRYTRPGIPALNIEATSGGNFARDEWYRQNVAMTDEAIRSGIYLRTHTDRETIAIMALIVQEHLMEAGRFQDAIQSADVVLAADPLSVSAMLCKGTAIAMIMKAEFYDKYPTPANIPGNLRARYIQLATGNHNAFAQAESLGWREPETEPTPIAHPVN